MANPNTEDDPFGQLVVDQKDETITVFAVEKVPGTAPGVLFYLIDQSVGLSLVDAEKGRQYPLSTEPVFSAARTLAVALLDQASKDPRKGFRVLKLDLQESTRPEIKVFEFNEKYLTALDEKSEEAAKNESLFTEAEKEAAEKERAEQSSK